MKRIYRSRNDRIIAGVCGGFAEYLELDPTLVRLVWIFFTIFGGIGILAYIFSVILISEKDRTKTKEIKVNDDHDEKIVLWGIVIIVVGILLFFRHRPAVHMIWSTVGGNWFSSIFGLALVGLGIYLFLNRRDDGKRTIDKLNLSGLNLSDRDKKIAGVCGGIAEFFIIDSSIVRLIWVLGTLLSSGIGIILYIICILVFDKQPEIKVDSK